MQQAEQGVDGYLALLRTKMRQQGFSQLEVQQALSWGQSYVSQILNRQKKLRVDQVLATLGVIGVEPREFYAELYELSLDRDSRPESGDDLRRQVRDVRRLMRRMVKLLVRKKVVSAKEADEVL